MNDLTNDSRGIDDSHPTVQDRGTESKPQHAQPFKHNPLAYQDGGSGGVLGTILKTAMGVAPSLTHRPIIAFDTANPSQDAQAAFIKMVTNDPLGIQIQTRINTYIDRFGFDRSKPPVIRGPSIRKPWMGMTIADLDAAIAVSKALHVHPAHIVAVWISEGKIKSNSLLHERKFFSHLVPASDFIGATRAQIFAYARSVILFQFFGADPMVSFEKQQKGDNRILGFKARHNESFDHALDEIRTAGIRGFSERSNQEIRDFFTSSSGLVVRHMTTGSLYDIFKVKLADNSLASWLWLQASLFQTTQVKLERMLANLYRVPTVDLSRQPWVTYLFWNTNKDESIVRRYYYYEGANLEAAIARKFGSWKVNPEHLDKDQLDRYYSTGDYAPVGQSSAAWANAILVKFLVETIEPWFK